MRPSPVCLGWDADSGNPSPSEVCVDQAGNLVSRGGVGHKDLVLFHSSQASLRQTEEKKPMAMFLRYSEREK